MAEINPRILARRRKKRTKRTANGLPVQSFATLLESLGTRCRNTCQVLSDPAGATFTQLTDLDPLQTEAIRLLETLWTEPARVENAQPLSSKGIPCL
jgi:hypothetical protein